MVDYLLFIDGALRASTCRDSLDVINPALEEPWEAAQALERSNFNGWWRINRNAGQ